MIIGACQTGLGHVHSDSMIGLTNASLIVGAEWVGSTLWQIRDDLTVRLISRFYDGLLQKTRRPLRSEGGPARGVLRNPETRHPEFWAAFKESAGKASNPLFTKRRANSPLDVPPRPSTGSPG